MFTIPERMHWMSGKRALKHRAVCSQWSEYTSSMDILIHLGRLPSGERKILEISEVLDFDGTEYRLNPLFRYRGGKGHGNFLQSENPLVNTDRLLSYGQYDNYINAMERFDACREKITKKEE